MPPCLAAIAASLLCAAASPAPISIYIGRQNQLRVSVPRIDGADAKVVIDGSLTEPVWQRAALLTGFSEFSPADGIPAADSTQVLVWYSSTALYFGIRAFEIHGGGSRVHATLADRDKITADDNVQILLGTFHDRRQALVFGVNPFGVQMDGTIVEQDTKLTGTWTPTLSGRAAPDLTQDFVFTSKGRLTDYGYEVELEIPFKSIKYQTADVQTWDLNVVREVQHSGYEDSWAPARRADASFLGQSGSLDSLRGLDRGLVLDVNPIVTEKATGAQSPGGWSYTHPAPELGGNVRWGMTNNLTLNGTVHPDFAEVESDAGQVVTDPRQALYFPEKRPFFLDGLEQFTTPSQLIYTRRIVQPIAATKLTGNVAGTNLAVLSAIDDPSLSPSGHDDTYYNILRAQRDVAGASRIGTAFTDREVAGDYNRVADVDGRVVFDKIYSGSFQWAESYTRQAGTVTQDPLWQAIFSRNGKGLGLRYTFSGIGNDFLAQSGFISRPGVVNAGADHRATWFGERGSVLETLTGDVSINDTWQYSQFLHSGDAEDKRYHLSSALGLRGGWLLGGGVYWETYGYDPSLYANYRIQETIGTTVDTVPFVGVPRIPNRDYVVTVSTPQWSKLDGTLLYIGGQDENFFEWAQANIDIVSLDVNVRPTDQARVEGTLAYQDYWRRTDGSLVGRTAIPRLKLEYQLSRSIFLRAVAEYDLVEHDDLRDETRTFAPLLINGVLATAVRNRTLQGDYLFSYQPNPGTVLFLGYGSEQDGLPDPTNRFTWQPLQRMSDYFFVKLSYLLRM